MRLSHHREGAKLSSNLHTIGGGEGVGRRGNEEDGMTKYGGAGGHNGGDLSRTSRVNTRDSNIAAPSRGQDLPRYHGDQQWSAMGRVLLGLRTGNMGVFRSAKSVWMQRYPNDRLILAQTTQRYLGGYRDAVPQITDAKIRGLTANDLNGVDLSKITFVNPDIQKEQDIELLKKSWRNNPRLHIEWCKA